MFTVSPGGVGVDVGDGVGVAVGVGVDDTVPFVGIVRLFVNSAVVSAVSAMPTTISAAIVADPFRICILLIPLIII
jgi:hypothetical protein